MWQNVSSLNLKENQVKYILDDNCLFCIFHIIFNHVRQLVGNKEIIKFKGEL